MMMSPIDRKFPRPLPFPQPSPLPFPIPTQDTTVDNAVFDMLDGNGDGAVGKDEWTKAGWTADRFTAFDGNGDGKVDRKEFLQSRRFEREFNQKDWNKDGELNRQELTGFRYMLAKTGLSGAAEALGGAAKSIMKCMPMPLMDRFMKMDTDKSGGVSKEEYMKARRAEENRPIIWDDVIKPLPMYRHESVHAKAEVKKAANE